MTQAIIDSNIILRLLVKDDELQLEEARKIIKRVERSELTGLISILVLNEIIWILEKYYNLGRGDFLPKILRLLAIPGMKILEVNKSEVIGILKVMLDPRLDFTDVYLTWVKGSRKLFTFDKELLKLVA